MSGCLRHQTQAEGHYFVMVHHIFDSANIRNVMKMWKLGGSGQHQNFEHEVKHEIDWDHSSSGFTFPMQKKTVPG